jgi:hypothetical protein
MPRETLAQREVVLGLPASLLRTPLPEGKHRVDKLHVSVHRLLRQRLASLCSPLLLVGQLLAHLPSVLRLGTEVVDHPVEEVLGGTSSIGS